MIATDLPFPCHMHDFNSHDYLLSSFERLKSQHWFYPVIAERLDDKYETTVKKLWILKLEVGRSYSTTLFS